MPLSAEQLTDPTYAFETGSVFVHSLGIEFDPVDQPDAYAEALRKDDPRTAENLIRYQLEKSTQKLSPEAQAVLDDTVLALGMLEPVYPLPPEGRYGTMVVIGGARDALLDRSMFAANSIVQGVATNNLLLAGDPGRRLNDEEKDVTRQWAPIAQTEYDLARAATQRIRDEYPKVFGGMHGVSLAAFKLHTIKPDQRDVINEVILRAEALAAATISDVGKLAVVTTAIYVPFKTHDTLSATKRHGIAVDIAGVASRPEVIARRTPATYVTDTLRTLVAAAHHQATIRRLG
jgi:hypothetical protein